MVKVTKEKISISPTLKLVDSEGRPTAEFQRFLREALQVINAIQIEDGEVKANMIEVDSLEAISAVLGNVVINGELVLNGTLRTGKLGKNAATQATIATQVSDKAPTADFITQGVAAEIDPDITGVLILFFGFMDRPNLDPGNVGQWRLRLSRNGTQIDQTPPQFYDDNFAYPIVAAWFDTNPGLNPIYTIGGSVISGPGNFLVLAGGLGTFTLLKR